MHQTRPSEGAVLILRDAFIEGCEQCARVKHQYWYAARMHSAHVVENTDCYSPDVGEVIPRVTGAYRFNARDDQDCGKAG